MGFLCFAIIPPLLILLFPKEFWYCFEYPLNLFFYQIIYWLVIYWFVQYLCCLYAQNLKILIIHFRKKNFQFHVYPYFMIPKAFLNLRICYHLKAQVIFIYFYLFFDFCFIMINLKLYLLISNLIYFYLANPFKTSKYYYFTLKCYQILRYLLISNQKIFGLQILMKFHFSMFLIINFWTMNASFTFFQEELSKVFLVSDPCYWNLKFYKELSTQ